MTAKQPLIEREKRKPSRTIGVATVARSDYGIYIPILKNILADSDLHLHLIVSGSHLSPEFGLTIKQIENDGFEIGERVEMLLSSDTPEGIVKSMGLGMIGFAQAFSHCRPDILVVLGDRFEMHAAAISALPFKIPVVHIHGGEITEGAFDDALRHSITKLSHLHFVSTQEYARRVIQLGEEPWRVVVSGAPGLDNLKTIELISIHELESVYGLPMNPPPLLVTFHPATLEFENTSTHIEELLNALEAFDQPIIFTMPNADTNGRIIKEKMERYVQSHPNTRLIDNLGTRAYFSLMANAAIMVGNSSSGIIEAPSFGLPVVNIGTRQKGRVRGENVIDVGYKQTEIIVGIRMALKPEFLNRISKKVNPYGRGQASRIIVAKLKKIPLDNKLISKKFHNI